MRGRRHQLGLRMGMKRGLRWLAKAGKGWLACLRKPGKRRLALFGTLALSVCGCTTFREYVENGFKVGPNYRRAPAPVAQDWIDAADVRVRKDSPDLSRWWTVFNDPALDSLIGTAYQQNLTLREAGFRVLHARAQLGIAVGGLFPQSQYGVGGFTQRGVSLLNANRVATPQRYFSQWELGFGLAWELDFWGRYRRAVEAADADLDASVENYDDVLVTLLGDVARNYVEMRTLEQELEYVRTNVELQRETWKIAEARFKGGQATELDVDQAKSTLAQTEALIPQLRISVRLATNQLCILLGIPPEDLQAKLGRGGIPVAPQEVVAGIPAELLSRRPDVRRAEREAAAQSARIGVAESELYPHISIVGTIGYSSQDLANLFEPLAFTGSVAPSFKWNLLNYGRLVNNVRLQDARFQELVTNYQNTVLKANAEVEDGMVRFLRGHQRLKSLSESVEAAEKAVKVAIAQYKGGTVDFNRVSLVEQNLVQQQDLLAQARGEIARGLIQVYKALGGGWQIRCDPAVAPAATIIAAPESAKQPEAIPAPRSTPTPRAAGRSQRTAPKTGA